jgi:hypothetical protein
MKTNTLISLVLLTVFAAVSQANSNEQTVMGTVNGISANAVTIETMDKTRQSLAIALSPATKFIRDGAAAPAKDLKVGAHVVVVVKADGEKVDAVRIVFGTVFSHMDMHHQ